MAVELKEDQIKSVLQGISIPPQPQVMVDLQMEQCSPDCSIQRVAQLISQDVGLSGSVLKTVNSPFFGLRNKITSVQQACNLMGINSVINLVNALSIRDGLSDDNITALNRFWDSAMDVAMACATIAKQYKLYSSDEAYSLGLFHNAGIALMLLRYDDYLETMVEAYAKADQQRVIDTENQRYHSNHAIVGYYVGKSWNLPLQLCQAIADHHNGRELFSDKDSSQNDKKTLLAILKLAEHICGSCKSLGDQDEDHEWQQIEEQVLMQLGMSSYEVDTLKASCQEMGLGNANYIGMS